MTIITITLALLGHELIALTIDAPTEDTDDTPDTPDTVVVNDANVIHWDSEPEP